MTQTHTHTTLDQLALDDLRGLVVIDPYGHRIGEVEAVRLEPTEPVTPMLVVGSGGLLGLGRVRRLVPAAAVVEVGEHVRITLTHEWVHSCASVVLDVDARDA
jgi:sporulation protein YlmC with PRC-barrel domain